MHEYIAHIPNDPRLQSQPKVNHMPPIQEQVDPRLMARALEEIRRSSQAPMSAGDSVMITITPQDTPVYASNYSDPSSQQVDAFGKAIIQATPNPYQSAAQDEMMNALIRERTAEILQYAMGRGMMQSSIDGSSRPYIPGPSCNR